MTTVKLSVDTVGHFCWHTVKPSIELMVCKDRVEREKKKIMNLVLRQLLDSHVIDASGQLITVNQKVSKFLFIHFKK